MKAVPRLLGSESPLGLLCSLGRVRMHQFLSLSCHRLRALVKRSRSKAGAALCNQSQVDTTSAPRGLHTAVLLLTSGVTGARDELASRFEN